MVTDRNTIKICTQYNEQARKELHTPQTKIANKLIIGSCVLIVVSIFMMILAYYKGNNTIKSVFIGLLPVDLIVLLIGAISRRSISKALREPLPHTLYEYEIYDGGIAAKETIDGEVMHISKYYNKTVCKTTESAHYLFLFINASSALVIDKSALYPAELDTIKAIYYKQPSENILYLAPFKPGVPDFVEPPETDDVFSS